MATLFLLFTIIPVTELFLLIQVGQVIGAWETVAIVLMTGLLGAHMVRSQGMSILQTTQLQMARGELPAEGLLSGLLVFVAGVLLITPGFITDIWGMLLVFPLTRNLFVGFAKDYLVGKMKTGNFQFYTNVNGEWHSSEEWRDVSPEPEKMREPARVIDLNTYKNNQEPES